MKGQGAEEMFLSCAVSDMRTNPEMSPVPFHEMYFSRIPILHGDNPVNVSAVLWKGGDFIMTWSKRLYLNGGLKARILTAFASIRCSLFL